MKTIRNIGLAVLLSTFFALPFVGGSSAPTADAQEKIKDAKDTKTDSTSATK